MLGFDEVISKMKNSDLKVPDWVLEMQSKGFSSFYKEKDGQYYHYDLVSKDYKKINLRNDQITFASFIQRNKTIKKNWSASMIDLDDCVLWVELHSILKPDFNPLDGFIVSRNNKPICNLI